VRMSEARDITHTSDAMSSRPVNCLHVSLSMIFCTSGSISDRGVYKTLFYDRNMRCVEVTDNKEGTYKTGGVRSCHFSNLETTRRSSREKDWRSDEGSRQ